MKIVVTGAAGFVGATLVGALVKESHFSHLLLVDRHFPEDYDVQGSNISTLSGDINDSAVVEQIFSEDVDTLFHLAALPGGAAEADPALSKQINLDASLALFDAAAKSGCRRVVYASSIAVLDPTKFDVVDDSAPLNPGITYGYHKAMVELALADMSRRKALDVIGVRLPGILARPPAPSGLKSAFLSDVFHALKAHKPFVSPVSEQATFWLMSAEKCASNLIEAGRAEPDLLPSSSVMTFPSVRCSMDELVREIADQTGADVSVVSYAPDNALEHAFGKYPPLVTAAAERAGLASDGSLKQLVSTVLENL